jgi:AcrR family transcriptional regulator
MDAVAAADVRSTQLGPPPDAPLAEVAAAAEAGAEAVGGELVAAAELVTAIAGAADADEADADEDAADARAASAAAALVARAAAAVAGAAADVGALVVVDAVPAADDFEDPPQPVRAIEQDASTTTAAGMRAERSMEIPSVGLAAPCGSVNRSQSASRNGPVMMRTGPSRDRSELVRNEHVRYSGLMTPPASRRERPAKAALSRPGIISAALEIMRVEGLPKVTMRRLAQELDTGAASLYVYVRNTAELYAAMLDELLGGVDLEPATGKGDWRKRLEAVLTSYTMVLFDQPGLAQSALVTWPNGDNFFNLVEALLAILEQGRVEPKRASWAVDLLLQFATTTAAEHGTRAQAIDGEEQWDALVNAGRRVKPELHPHIAALGDDLWSGEGTQRLTWGYAVLINGIIATPRP